MFIYLYNYSKTRLQGSWVLGTGRKTKIRQMFRRHFERLLKLYAPWVYGRCPENNWVWTFSFEYLNRFQFCFPEISSLLSFVANENCTKLFENWQNLIENLFENCQLFDSLSHYDGITLMGYRIVNYIVQLIYFQITSP